MENPEKKILFLGYDTSQTRIIEALIKANCEVHHTDEAIDEVVYDLIVSFGYRHIIKRKTIDASDCPILNLHISYLPYNKGAHPNFWSFYDNTPSGVTIHLIDDGIDTGPIIFQKYVNFNIEQATFSETRQILINEIENLFIGNLQVILANLWEAKPQRGQGSLHHIKDLPDEFRGWDTNILQEITRLDSTLEK